MSFVIGFDAKLYYLTTGTRATWPGSGAPANLDEVPNVRDLTLNLSKTEADVTTRGGAGWRQIIAALKDASVEFEMVYDNADADFTAFQDSFINNTVIPCAVLDGGSATAGTQGLWADFMVTGFEQQQPLDGAVMVRVTIKPTYSSVAPEWITVA